MHDFGILEWFIGLLGLIVFLVILWIRKHSVWYLLTFSVFWLYLLMLVDVLIFPLPLGSDLQVLPGQQTWQMVLRQVNPIPFEYLIQADGSTGAILNELLSNILLAMPLGFGLNFVTRVKPSNFVWQALLIGLFFEAAQLGVSLFLGVAYRTVDVTDVILNTAGILLGYSTFRLFAWLYRRGLGAYIAEVVGRS